MPLQEDLCMRSSEENRERTDQIVKGDKGGPSLPARSSTVSRIGCLAVIIAVLVCAEVIARQCFDSAHYADHYKRDIRRIESTGSDVDMVVAGASQVYHGCDTSVLASEMGYEEVLDASTASQSTDGAYYMVEYLLSHFSPEYVVVNLNWDRLFPKKQVNLHRGRLLVGDYISETEKIKYFLDCAPVGQWFNLSYLYRFGGTVTGISQLKENYENRKKTADPGWTADTSMSSYYGGNGFIVFKDNAPYGSMNAEKLTFSEEKIAGHEVEYTLKIAELCRKKGIKLIWITIPTTLAELYSVDDYQAAVDYLTSFCAQTGYPYINFSMLKNREELFPDTVFSDHIHLSLDGAERFSKLLADTIRKVEAGEDISGMFYDSFEELKKDVHRIPGCFVYVKRKRTGDYKVKALSVQNDGLIPEYRLLLKQDSGEWELLSDWQESPDFVIAQDAMTPEDELRIETRRKGETEYDCFWELNVQHALDKKTSAFDGDEENS